MNKIAKLVWSCDGCGDEYEVVDERKPFRVEGKRLCGFCICIQCYKQPAKHGFSLLAVCSRECWEAFFTEWALEDGRDPGEVIKEYDNFFSNWKLIR